MTIFWSHQWSSVHLVPENQWWYAEISGAIQKSILDDFVVELNFYICLEGKLRHRRLSLLNFCLLGVKARGGLWSLLWFHFPSHFSLSPIFSIQDISSDYFTCHLVGRLVVGKRGVFSSMALPHHVRHVRHPLQAGPHLLHPWTKIRDWQVRNRSSSSLSHVCQVIWNSCTGRE